MVGMGDTPASFLFRVTKEDSSLPCSPVSLMTAFPRVRLKPPPRSFPSGSSPEPPWDSPSPGNGAALAASFNPEMGSPTWEC